MPTSKAVREGPRHQAPFMDKRLNGAAVRAMHDLPHQCRVMLIEKGAMYCAECHEGGSRNGS